LPHRFSSLCCRRRESRAQGTNLATFAQAREVALPSFPQSR
jgi:hypothetical protein